MAAVQPILKGHWSSLPTGKIVLMCAMTGFSFEFSAVDLFAGEQDDGTFRALNFAGQVPILVAGDDTVRQSAMILRYLADRTGRLGGADGRERQLVLERLFFEADQFASLRIPRTLTFVYGEEQPEVLAFHRKRAARTLTLLDAWFRDNDFAVGAVPTIADVAFFPILDTCAEGGFSLDPFPAIRAWIGRMRSMAGVAGHYELMAAVTEVRLDELPGVRKRRAASSGRES